ncbi:hypothetical protein NUW58_g6528 [Xylaria curta]|uniref:Uncharacterized protein n=1 Tax=Xylaria curta TaxID=42375 RepID=A0ACC1NRZ6_9PEZI|nr:hypothetical protein NUW58_g6528 [Xylaria curta]
MLPIKRKRQRSASDARRRQNKIATLAPSTPPESGILRLPYELLLAIFHRLSNQRDVDALARTHPVFKVVHRENIQPIERAVRCNDIARFVEKETGYRSLYLVKFARAIFVLFRTRDFEYALSSFFKDEYFQNLRRNYKDDYGLWLRSCRNQAVCLHMLGFFDSAPTPDLWHKQRFRPMFSGYPGTNIDFSEFFKKPSHPIADFRRGHHQSITWYPRARFEDIELLMVVRLWCCRTLGLYVPPESHHSLSRPAISVSDFMSLFTPDVAHRAREFARRFMKGMAESS